MDQPLRCILLIDDDEPTNYLNNRIITRARCAQQVEVVQGGQSALQYLCGCREFGATSPDPNRLPELILLDINMPAMDGWEFLEKYRELPRTSPIDSIMIMLTTSLNPDDNSRAQQTPEIASYESKPFTDEMLARILSRHFSPNRS
ncbi:MAG: response regulator [Candidatus Pseudobacter hemicellulosilyticus]|uniref:Response regulator n=1 Tax=Candidatus Pseudobacter hemicellulosilyticus TaxID=3121375 RepID=A0AAJ5WTE3_9BACT|nr:MAG: response regulator [Pseudobacter sp.]